MFELSYPWLLALLPVPLLVRWLMPPHRERVRALRIPFFAQFVEASGQTAGEGSVILRREVLQVGTVSLVWLLLLIALARPEWVGAPIVREEAARDIMLAIDLSGSMDTVDFPDQEGKAARRLEVVQRVVDEFIAARDGDRIGLIVFGTRPYVQLPFTRDLDTARKLVGLMQVAMAGPHTAIGDAIGLAIKTFESSKVDQRLMILLTDGNDTGSKMTPINAADIAHQKDVEIFTIGVGDPAAAGEDRVDFDTLRAVAKRSGGQFFSADDEVALSAVYRRIDALRPQDVRTQSYRPRRSLVHLPVGVSVVLGVLAYAALLLRQRTGGA